MLAMRKFLSASGLLSLVRNSFEKVKPPATAGLRKKDISYADCLMSAFAMFNLKYPSLLQFDTSHRLDPQVEHNLKTLYGIEQIPSDTCMRERLDEGDPGALRKAYKRLFSVLQRGKALESYRYLNGRYLVAGDGTGFFSSGKVHCENCCVRRTRSLQVTVSRAFSLTASSLKKRGYVLTNPMGSHFALHYIDEAGGINPIALTEIASLSLLLEGKKAWKELSKTDKAAIKESIASWHYEQSGEAEQITWYHNLYCAAIVHPDRKTVIPLVPEPIMKSDGMTKNDCERNASKRLFRDLKREHPHLKVIVVEDSLASNYPHLQELQNLGMQFIAGVKQGDHEALFNWVDEQICQGYEYKTDDGTTHCFRYVNEAPLSKNHADFKVNFMEYREIRKNGDSQYFCWVTDILINNENAYDIMRGGRSNWKVENPIFNTLKNQNYHFNHNFGHGYKNLSTMMAMLMMLAFFVDQTQELCCTVFQQALKIRKSKIGLWEKIRGIFFHYYVNNWTDLFHTLIHGPPRVVLGTESAK